MKKQRDGGEQRLNTILLVAILTLAATMLTIALIGAIMTVIALNEVEK